MGNDLDAFIKLTLEPENCEDDNWGDACNFVAAMEKEINRLKAEKDRLINVICDGKIFIEEELSMDAACRTQKHTYWLSNMMGVIKLNESEE